MPTPFSMTWPRLPRLANVTDVAARVHKSAGRNAPWGCVSATRRGRRGGEELLLSAELRQANNRAPGTPATSTRVNRLVLDPIVTRTSGTSGWTRRNARSPLRPASIGAINLPAGPTTRHCTFPRFTVRSATQISSSVDGRGPIRMVVGAPPTTGTVIAGSWSTMTDSSTSVGRAPGGRAVGRTSEPQAAIAKTHKQTAIRAFRPPGPAPRPRTAFIARTWRALRGTRRRVPAPEGRPRPARRTPVATCGVPRAQ